LCVRCQTLEVHLALAQIESIGQSITLDQGGALIHASALRHGGHPLTAGQRWVLAVFLNPAEMPASDHGRRFHNRATWIAQTLHGEAVGRRGRAGETVDVDQIEREVLEDELRECYAFAVEETDGKDFEVFVNVARHALTVDRPLEAMKFLRRAAELNPTDANVVLNMGAAYRQLGWQCDAFHAFHYAACLNPHNRQARSSAADLLREHGRDELLGGMSHALADDLRRFADELAGDGEVGPT